MQDPYDIPFYIAAAAVTATPTSGTMLIMTELAGGNRKAMSTCIFAQYLAAPVLLTVTITILVIAVSSE